MSCFERPAKLSEFSIAVPEAGLLRICLSAPEARRASGGSAPRFRNASARLVRRIHAAADASKALGEFRADNEEIAVRMLETRGRDAG